MSEQPEISEIEFFNDCLDALAVDLVKDDLDVGSHRYMWGNPSWQSNPSEEEIRKSAWIASVLASSQDDEDIKKALAFGILSYLNHKDGEKEQLYEKYLYVILSRVGNLPAFDNVDTEDEKQDYESALISSLDSVLGLELATNKKDSEIRDGWILSRFQKEIYEYLQDGKNVAISGPTSAGKSFILRRYIEHKVESQEEFEGIYVVPTRALISEVSRKLSNLHEDISVRTGAHFSQDPDAEEDEESHTFLVVTPERCRKLVDPEVRNKISPDLVFLDEVQNVEDEERGVLFEGIVNSLAEFYPSAQIVAAGPYLENPGETLKSLTNKRVKEVKSAFTPVLQLKVSLKFVSQPSSSNRQMKVNIHSPSGEQRQLEVPEPENLTFSDVKSSKTQAIPEILEEFGAGSKNLVYSGRKDYAERRAKAIAENKQKRSLSPDLEGLKDFLARTIHEDYSLIYCLERGIAFHHGMVPKIAREEIEEIYSNTDELDTIVTTPTLMQGVNLPAEKIFLVGAKRGKEDLTGFEFNNLIGRVGRVDTKLYGAIYCIEAEDEWADDKLEEAGEKEVESATSKAVSDSEELIDALRQKDLSSVEEASVKYTTILLRGRYLKEPGSVDKYLEEKGMDKNDRSEAKEALSESLAEIDIPEELLRKNPTVDPISQNELYESVRDDPESWVVGETQYQMDWERLRYLARKLNSIFKFTNDSEEGVSPEHVETGYKGLVPITVYANQWLQGSTYQAMIKSRQEADAVPDEDINKSIREVMKMVDKDICFVLVKYFGVLTTILEEVEYEFPDWMVQLDKMLEMGSKNFAELRLMSEGVDRSVAVDLVFPQGTTDPIQYLRENRRGFAPFIRRHLEKQNIL
ncbi:DEAD/DEAH box helicase [Halorubellus litoreus]|uniref:DEAD/DEAH box helicase n=1 Tax=Halorubellus litoreus TaxID=755308 RepID=A0ABD5VPG3_9EURY